ncbi:MAG: sarcosine oxidase subunit gamma [Variibacter sp.]
MAEATLQLKTCSAFDGLLVPGGPKDAGIVVAERANLQIASVMARSPTFAQAVKAAYGINLPDGSKRVVVKGLAFLGTGPRTWLAVRAGGAPLAAELRQFFGASAAVADQSDGYGILRIAGRKVRALLEKGVPLDLHPHAFAQDDVAATTCAHIGLILWRADTDSTFDVALFRSLCESFWRWLAASAEECGLRVDAAIS